MIDPEAKRIREMIEESGATFPSDESKESLVTALRDYLGIQTFPNEDPYLASVMGVR